MPEQDPSADELQTGYSAHSSDDTVSAHPWYKPDTVFTYAFGS